MKTASGPCLSLPMPQTPIDNVEKLDTVTFLAQSVEFVDIVVMLRPPWL